MKRKITLIILLFSLPFIFIVSFYSCRSKNKDLQLNLRWVKAYPGENWGKVRCGILWSLSFLGAELPKGSFDNAVTRKDSSRFALDLSRIGFKEKAQEALAEIIEKLKESDEYKKTGAVDVGRFLVLTLHSSLHYYAITGAYAELNQFKTKYNIVNPLLFPVTKSAVSRHERLLKFNAFKNWRQFGFLAEEGNGSFLNGTFRETETEVFDIMPNGQLRFAIYDKQGNLKASADASLTAAGKPGKCLWCHETSVNTIFLPTDNVNGYMRTEEFGVYIDEFQRQLKTYRDSLNSDINFNNLQDHTQSELLYISFMEPSLSRLAIEWQMDTTSVKNILKDLPVHVYSEFLFLGKLYHRKDIDKLAPFKGLQVPESVREPGAFEPDYINQD